MIIVQTNIKREFIADIEQVKSMNEVERITYQYSNGFFVAFIEIKEDHGSSNDRANVSTKPSIQANGDKRDKGNRKSGKTTAKSS